MDKIVTPDPGEGAPARGEAPVDVLVIGGGNAGFTAAHAAAGRGRSVRLLEKGGLDEAGGNSYYTAGATRIAHGGLEDLRALVEDDERLPVTEVPPYPAADYAADLARVTEGRNDPALTEVLVGESRSTVQWLHELGLRYRLLYERQSYRRADGSYLFWGGLHIGNVGGGVGMVDDHTRIAEREGVDVRYGHEATGLVVEDGRVCGVHVLGPGAGSGAGPRAGPAEGERAGSTRVRSVMRAESVVLAAGGFEASAALRRRHLGEGWQHAKVRGTPLNTGTMIQAALGIGAAAGGDWTTCHSVAWDAEAEDNESNRALTNRLTRQSYPLGIVVNRDGRRFLDEGADFRNYTYARYGRAILAQPGSVAYQLFDAELRPMLRSEEYDMPGASVSTGATIAALAGAIGVDPDALTSTVTAFNASIDRSVPFDPAVKDGRAARVEPPKSNWAMPLETPPFYAFPVTCGITFTFGGLAGDTSGRVLDGGGQPIPGLFVCGEMLGGLFSGNYPGGSGLTAGAVFGRRAGLLA